MVMQDCAQYTEVDKEMKEVMLKVLGKERLSGNGCGLSLATMAAHTFGLTVAHWVTNEGSHARAEVFH
jgi:hypothetical protein